MIGCPRFQGKVGQAEDHADNPPDVRGKWFFTLWVSIIGDGKPPRTLLENCGPWPTEDVAKAHLRKACQICVESYEQAVTGKVSGDFIDLKDNLQKNFKDVSCSN